MWFQATKSIDRSGTHVVSVYATGLNNHDKNVREERKLLTRWYREKMTTICISFPNTFVQTIKKSLQFVPKGAVHHKAKLVQAMAWYRDDTKPLPKSLVIWANGAYMSLSDWLRWLLHRIRKIYPCGEKRYCLSTRGIPSPHSWKWAIPNCQVGSGRGTGWPYFVKSPLTAVSLIF